VAEAEGREYEPLTRRGARVHTVRQAKAMSAPDWPLCAQPQGGRRRNQDEVRQRLTRIGGQEQRAEHDHPPGQHGRDIRGRLADVLGKARAEDQEREKARQKELDEERKRQRERDRDRGWEL
jgi:hypothetical protein